MNKVKGESYYNVTKKKTRQPERSGDRNMPFWPWLLKRSLAPGWMETERDTEFGQRALETLGHR